DSGSGGGLRLQHVNGTDVLNIPNGNRNCKADLGAGANSSCDWNSVSVTNNIIVNNVAGWDGAGVSLLDALAVNLVNNTIASNDSTASSGTLFQSLFAPLASAVAPTTNVTCGATNGQSCPQVAGLVSVNNSPVLQANINQLPANAFSCPPGHGSGGSCFYNSIPLMLNDVIWQNRSFYIGVGGFGPAAANQNQQHVVTLYPKGSTSAAASQTFTGACPAGSSYWDIGFRGDTDVTAHIPSGFVPRNSVLSAATATSYGGTGNLVADPAFTSQYCNGSRTPPELGAAGYAVPPGVNEFNGFPNPVFSLNPSGVVDEGNNWVNVRWGPLALTSPATNAVLGNYVPAAGSSAINNGTASVVVAGSTVAAPKDDFFGNVRPAGGAYDIGAVEVGAVPPLAVLNVAPAALSFTAVQGYSSSAQTVTLHNTGNIAANLGGLAFSSPVFTRAGGSCGSVLNAGANCTITLVFTPVAAGTASGALTIFADVAVSGSPLTLNGTVVAPVASATLTSATWTVAHRANCPGSGAAVLACLLDPVQTFTLTNSGNVPLTGITQGTLSGTNLADFAVVEALSTCGPATGGQLVATTTLAPGATCTTMVQFKPQTAEAPGAKTVTLSVTSVAGTQTAALTGTDAAPALTAVAPASAVRGAIAAVSLTGSYLDGASAVTVTGGGVNCAIAPAGQTALTTLTANCTVNPGAAPGSRTITVLTPTGSSNTQPFSVTGATASLSAPVPALNTAIANTSVKTGTITVGNAAAATGALKLTANPIMTKVGTAGGSFAIVSGGSCVTGAVVSPGSSCTIKVQYTPGTSTATATANVTITGSGLAATTLTSANFTGN
ncbi:MAG: choice-of-anchor D domain-containing protein, partial [Pseudomonadota bacterium]|nr:choice-of-anchor D domain-containing protein [Pseudomonadota bacterium]